MKDSDFEAVRMRIALDLESGKVAMAFDKKAQVVMLSPHEALEVGKSLQRAAEHMLELSK